MGVATHVIAAGEVDRYAFAVETLRAHGMEPPAMTEASRNPSPQELRAVLDDLEGYAATYTVSANNWHLVALDLRAPSGGKYTELRQSLDGGAWALHSPTNFYVPSGSPAGTVLRCDSVSRLDEAVVWKDADLFTTDELANLHDLADAFGLGMDQYGEQYEAPICWQATAVMPDGTVWRDAGCGPCPAVIRVPRGATDVVVPDEGRTAHPRIVEG